MEESTRVRLTDETEGGEEGRRWQLREAGVAGSTDVLPSRPIATAPERP